MYGLIFIRFQWLQAMIFHKRYLNVIAITSSVITLTVTRTFCDSYMLYGYQAFGRPLFSDIIERCQWEKHTQFNIRLNSKRKCVLPEHSSIPWVNGPILLDQNRQIHAYAHTHKVKIGLDFIGKRIRLRSRRHAETSIVVIALLILINEHKGLNLQINVSKFWCFVMSEVFLH